MTEDTEFETENFRKDAIYQGPHSLAPFPLSVSSPKIEPVDKRLLKANAFETMQYQANQQIQFLKKQADLLIEQAREIEKRLLISEKIYKSDISFEPIIGAVYHIYEDKGKTLLSLIAPEEWGKKSAYENYICSVRLLADKSWELLK